MTLLVRLAARCGTRSDAATLISRQNYLRGCSLQVMAGRCAATAMKSNHNDALISSFGTSARQLRQRKPYDFVKNADRFETLLLSTDEAEGISGEEVGTILALNRSQFDELVEALDDADDAGAAATLLRAYVSTNKFKAGELLPLPKLSCSAEIPYLKEAKEIDLSLAFVLCVEDDKEAVSTSGSLGLNNLESSFHDVMKQLPKVEADGSSPKAYRIICPSGLDGYNDVLSYLLGSYKFERYKNRSGKGENMPALIWPQCTDTKEASAAARATYLARDLISTPAIDFGPEDLQVAVESLATRYGADVKTVIGDDLLDYSGNVSDGHGCGMIHAVGQGAASGREPRLIDMHWSPTLGAKEDAPTITLVGKGIVYDTGGLNLKPGASMLNMKKDMGGAAHAIAVASILFESKVEANIRVLIPTAENCIGSNAYRPGDIITAVNGTTTEIGNTDAEGRLVLGDALAIASADAPGMIIDFATLTGAARVALGQEIPAFLSNCDELAQDVLSAAVSTRDPVWRLPLWASYEKRITDSSKVADLRNIPTDGGLGGAITAALYLKQFVANDISWAHFDVYGMMKGTTGIGEAQGARAVAELIQRKCSQ